MIDEARPRRRRQPTSAETLAQQLDGSFASPGVDAVFAQQLRENKSETGGVATYVSTGKSNRLIGLPLPALSLCYIIQSTVLPYQRAVQIPGPPGSCKSLFLFELMRWVLLSSGGVYYKENEKKDAEILRNSLLDHQLEMIQRLRVTETETMDEWMSSLLTDVAKTVALHTGPKAIVDGWRFPYLYAVDSLMSTPTAETLEKQKKEGVGRGYAIEANYLARFGRGLPDMLGGRPFLLAVTNHYKPSKDPATGVIVRNIPGGEAFKFMESAELELSRVKDINKADYGGVLIKIRAYKNCFGDSRRSIQVPVVWRRALDPATGDLLQWTMWDWYSGTVNLFESLRVRQKGLWNRLNEVVDFHVDRGRVWSKALEIERADAVTPFEAGWKLEQRDDLLEQLYGLLHIFRGRFFQPGKDYQAMFKEEWTGPSRPSERNYPRPKMADVLVAGSEDEDEGGADDD